MLALAGPVQASSLPDEIWFSTEWCPRQEELDELSKYLTLTMNDCCIRMGIPNTRYSKNPKVLDRWAHRIWTGVNPTAACIQKHFSPDEEDALRRAYWQERESVRQNQDRMKKDAGVAMRNLSTEDFCVAYGKALRGDQEYGTNVDDVARSEARRRKMTFDNKVVRNEQVRIGMSVCQMLASWGWPQDQNRSVGSWGTHVQHVYGQGGPYIYTENGRITSWQD